MNQNEIEKNFIERESGTAFSLAVILPYFIMFVFTLIASFIYKDYINTTWYVYATYLVSQIGNFFIVLYFCLRKRQNFFKLLNVNKFSFKYIIIILSLSFGLLFGLGYLNDLFVSFLKSIGLSYNALNVPLNNVSELISSLIIIALLPAVFEELLFRGIILSGTSKFKLYQAVLFNGLLFSLFHQNPAQTIYQFIMGCIFAIIVLKSGSVLPSIIMHFINNAIIILLLYFFPEVNFYKWWIIILSIIIFIVALSYILFFDRKGKINNNYVLPDKKQFFITSAIGLVFSVAMWIIALF